MKSFHLEGGEGLTVWGWLLLVATAFIEFGLIAVAVKLGLQNVLPVGQALAYVLAGVALCIFVAGAGLLECVGLAIMKETDASAKNGTGPTDF